MFRMEGLFQQFRVVVEGVVSCAQYSIDLSGGKTRQPPVDYFVV